MAWEYKFPPVVSFRGEEGKSYALRSETGVKQGHGFGSVIYAIGKHPVYKAMADEEEDRDLTVVAFQDDAVAASADGSTLRKTIRRWIQGTEELGGIPNARKCKVYCNDDSLAAEAKALASEFGFKFTTDGLEICGVPVGSDEYVKAALAAKVDSHSRLFGHLKQMDPQCANLLLRLCAQPRMGHLLRCVPVEELLDHAGDFDNKILNTFLRIGGLDAVGMDLESLRCLLQARLKDGGFGLRSNKTINPAANIASLLLVLPVLLKFFPGCKIWWTNLSRKAAKSRSLPTKKRSSDGTTRRGKENTTSLVG
jgi:hypothetical protein